MTSPPLSTSRYPYSRPSRSTIDRVNTINRFIAIYKTTMDVRLILTNLNRNHGRYCALCTPTFQPPGTCARTCPLLRPSTGQYHDISRVERYWMRDAEDFNDLVADIEHRGYGVGHGRLSRWERVVDRLKDDDLNNAEVMLEDGLTERRFRVQYPERMKVGWNFEEAWGKGVGIEEDVAPDEMPGGNQTGQVVPGEVVPDEVVTGDGAPEHEELKTVDPTDGDSGIDMDGDVEKASPSVKRLGDDVEKITSKVKRLRDALERLHL